jgi:hypothetical protein
MRAGTCASMLVCLFVRVYECVCVRARVCVCVCVRACVRACLLGLLVGGGGEAEDVSQQGRVQGRVPGQAGELTLLPRAMMRSHVMMHIVLTAHT